MVEEIWQSCKEQLKNTLGETSFDTWIAPLNARKNGNTSLVLEAPDGFFKNWVETNYLAQIKQALEKVGSCPPGA